MAYSTERIHPTAIISKDAEIAADVVIGPYVIIEGKVRIGPGCVLHHGARLCGALTLGAGNQVFTGAVLGERPQHVSYQDEPTAVEIGDDNIFREHVTVHRGTVHSWTTRIGSRNVFMANSHVAHDSQIGNRCTLANGALIGGHCILDDDVYLDGNTAVHQFVHIGRLARLGLTSVMTKDLPPFMMAQEFNSVCGVNVAGMQQAGYSAIEIKAIQGAFGILYRENNILDVALEKIDREFPGLSVTRDLMQFIRESKRGVVFGTKHFCENAAMATEKPASPTAEENVQTQTRPRGALPVPANAPTSAFTKKRSRRSRSSAV
jgi:UDP-N-acetylglucosamine acyltransferase